MKLTALILFSLLLYNGFAQTTLTGRTTGALPYLEYRRGDDRLGGAKMTYLDTGILIQVADSSGSDYKVKLSANRTAYLPKTNFKQELHTTLMPFYLSGSWRVYGEGRHDYLRIALPEKLPYQSMQGLSPSTIIIDVFGVTSNTNWISQLPTVKAIGNVWYEQIEDGVLRIHIELRQVQHWGHAIFYNGTTLVVRVKQQPVLKLRALTIAIDAGHGGANTGAVGVVTKVEEKHYTLAMARKLQKYLERKGATVYMTRNHDTDITMIERTALLREKDPDLLISMHLNSSSNAAVKGTSTYYRYIGFRSLSQALLAQLLELDLHNFGNIGAFNFALSGPTEYPNCLVEVAFLSNREDEQKIKDERFQTSVAKKLYKGLRNWLRAM